MKIDTNMIYHYFITPNIWYKCTLFHFFIKFESILMIDDNVNKIFNSVYPILFFSGAFDRCSCDIPNHLHKRPFQKLLHLLSSQQNNRHLHLKKIMFIEFSFHLRQRVVKKLTNVYCWNHYSYSSLRLNPLIHQFWWKRYQSANYKYYWTWVRNILITLLFLKILQLFGSFFGSISFHVSHLLYT